MAKVAIGFILYSKTDVFALFAQSLQNQTFQDFELFCRDNTQGGFESLVREHFLNIHYSTGENIGWGPSHNQMFAQSESELYLALNVSQILEPDCLEKMVAAIDLYDKNGRQYAAATATVCQLDVQKAVAGEVSAAQTDRIDTIGHSLLLDGRVVNMYQGQALSRCSFDMNGLYEVFGVSGCLALYRRSAVITARLGDVHQTLFDPAIFMYKEDVELDWTLARAGFSALWVPCARSYYARTARHEGSTG